MDMTATCNTSHKHEQQVIDDLLQEVQQNKAQRVVVNFYAPGGFGKSDKLLALWEDCAGRYPAALAQVRDYKSGEAFDRSAMLRKLVSDLEARLPRASVTPLEDPALRNPSALVDHIADLAEAAKVKQKPVLLFFDDYDYLPEVDRRWLEDRLLDDLAATRRVILVLSSKLKLTFEQKSFELRTRLQRHQLRAYTFKEIGCEYPQHADLATHIHALTGGMPSLVKLLVGVLDRLGVDDVRALRAHREEVLSAYYAVAIPELLNGEPERIQELVQILALPRRFDAKVVGEILERIGNPAARPGDTFYYLDLLGELDRWLRWRDEGGYKLHPPHRVVLQDYIRYKGLDVYQDVHQALVAFYRESLTGEYRDHYVQELLYHRLCLERDKQERAPLLGQAPADVSIDALLQGTNGHTMEHINQEQATRLQKVLMGDADLRRYFNPREIHEILSRLIRQLKSPPPWIEEWKYVTPLPLNVN
jgi:hypothetical protein